MDARIGVGFGGHIELTCPIWHICASRISGKLWLSVEAFLWLHDIRRGSVQVVHDQSSHRRGVHWLGHRWSPAESSRLPLGAASSRVWISFVSRACRSLRSSRSAVGCLLGCIPGPRLARSDPVPASPFSSRSDVGLGAAGFRIPLPERVFRFGAGSSMPFSPAPLFQLRYADCPVC